MCHLRTLSLMPVHTRLFVRLIEGSRASDTTTELVEGVVEPRSTHSNQTPPLLHTRHCPCHPVLKSGQPTQLIHSKRCVLLKAGSLNSSVRWVPPRLPPTRAPRRAAARSDLVRDLGNIPRAAARTSLVRNPARPPGWRSVHPGAPWRELPLINQLSVLGCTKLRGDANGQPTSLFRPNKSHPPTCWQCEPSVPSSAQQRATFR